MTFLEALKSKKRFRAVGSDDWKNSDGFFICNPEGLQMDDMPSITWFLSDFEIEENKVEITRTDLQKAFNEYAQGPYVSSVFDFVCRKLGL